MVPNFGKVMAPSLGQKSYLTYDQVARVALQVPGWPLLKTMYIFKATTERM